MSYEDKLAHIRALIEQFNASAPEESDKISIEVFEKKLRKTGAVSEDTLRAATWEDFEDAGLPRILARRVADIARTSESGDKKEFISSKRAERMSVRELVESYDLNESIESPVTSRLKVISKGKRCLVMSQDGAVNVDLTVKLITEITDGYDDREVIEVDGAIRPVLRIGDKTATIRDENPVFRGEALRFDGTCQHTDLNWSEVPFETKQLVALIAGDPQTTGPATPKLAIELHELATNGKLVNRYRKHVVKLAELKELGKAPSLKVKLTSTGSGRTPFGKSL